MFFAPVDRRWRRRIGSASGSGGQGAESAARAAPWGRLDKIQVKDIRQWLNKLPVTCQCCAQGKDAVRPEGKGVVARLGNAASKRCPYVVAKTRVTHSAQRLPVRLKTRQSTAIPLLLSR
jgi:hypothetical protein